MICPKCGEQIEVGEACIPEAVNGSNHFRFYHPNCYLTLKGEHDEESRLRNTAALARTVN